MSGQLLFRGHGAGGPSDASLLAGMRAAGAQSSETITCLMFV
jgi:hypothetical protein